MIMENAHNPNPTGVRGDPSEGEVLPPAHGKAAWTTPTLTVLSGKRTEWNLPDQVVTDDGVAS
jgi:hypothetical protein